MVWSEREAFRKEEGGEECDVLMRILQAYRFALDPSPRRERAMRAHLGARRFAYNWGLALVKTRLGARARGDDVDVPCNLPALRREWNRAKEMAAPWWREHSKEAYSSGLDALARGLRAFFDSREGRRRGRRVGFPVFRKKGGSRQSVRFTTGAIAVADRTHIILPRLGRIRTHEATTALAERIAAGTARILTATLSREGDRWFVSFNCEVDRALRRPAHPPASSAWMPVSTISRSSPPARLCPIPARCTALCGGLPACTERWRVGHAGAGAGSRPAASLLGPTGALRASAAMQCTS
jgi:hypothetical protein